MKPTHILVPIDEFDAIGDNNADRYKQLYLVLNSPTVDLSEVGVLGTSIIAVHKRYGAANDAYEEGYQQCARDLLNTKS